MSWKKKILRLFGTNEVQLGWKWRRFKERFGKRGDDEENERRHVGYKHKHCPSCRALVDRDDKVCNSCGADVPSIAAVKAERALSALLPDENPVTKILLAVLLGFFVLVTLDGINRVGSENAFQVILGPPFEVMLRWGAHVRGFFEPWRIVMSNFIHFGILHLGFNAWALKIAGPEVERAYGSALAFALFVVTGIAGMAFSNLVGGPGLVAGASASIMGYLALAGVAGHREGTTRGRQVRDAMFRWALFVMFLGIVASSTGTFAIDNLAHGGGLVAGVLLGFSLPQRSRGGWRSVAMRRAVAGTVFATLAVVGYGVYGMVENQLGNVAFEECYTALREDRFDDAVPACERAVEVHGDSIAARNNLAYALLRSGRGEEAVQVCDAAAKKFGASEVRLEAPACAELL